MPEPPGRRRDASDPEVAKLLGGAVAESEQVVELPSSPGLAALGWDGERADEARAHEGRPGRVVRQDRGWVQVACDDVVRPAKTREDRVGTPVVGDWVVVAGPDPDDPDDDGDDEVAAVLARATALRRADPVGEGEQVLAANLDRVLVVAGLDRPVKAGRLQRALAQVWDSGAEPVLVLSKADLADDPDGDRDRIVADHPGPDVVTVSAVTGDGVDDLRTRLAGDTVVLLGESGAGKSSLLNALAGDEIALVGDVRTADAKGRHTTTRRELHVLPGGAIVIDTPGVRAVGLYADAEAIDATFPDIEALAEGCRFADCTHDHEPGCAVRRAVEDGALPPARLDAFRELHAEAARAREPDRARRRGSGRRGGGRRR